MKFNHCEKLNAVPLMCIITGQTGSGKTHLLFNMLTTEGILDFDKLLIYTPTHTQPYFQLLLHGFNNNLKKEVINDLFKIYEEDNLDIEDIPLLIENANKDPENLGKNIEIKVTNKEDDLVLENNKKKTVVVFDDCVTNKRQDIQQQFFIRGRHNNCNCIYLSQSYYGIDKDFIRKNANVYILFGQNSRSVTTLLQDIDVGIENKDFKQLANRQWHDPQEHKYIVINTRKPRDNRVFDSVF